MTRYLSSVDSPSDQVPLRALFLPIVDRMSCQVHSTAGLVISGAAAATAKIGAADCQYIVQGYSRVITAATVMPALVGTITAASFNVFCFFADSAGTVTSAMGTEGTTRALLKFPPFPQGKTLVGYLVVTYASTFTGGTTALDTATTVYVSPLGSFDPSVLV